MQFLGSYCGPYLISWAYWSDGGKPGGDYVNCATDRYCSERAVEGYMQKWKNDCNGDGVLDCTDFAIIHKTGPYSCNTSTHIYETNYWRLFESCIAPPIDVRSKKLN